MVLDSELAPKHSPQAATHTNTQKQHMNKSIHNSFAAEDKNRSLGFSPGITHKIWCLRCLSAAASHAFLTFQSAN